MLGLVIERPDQTVSQIARSLERRFPRARFAPSTAHNALRQMSEGKRQRVLCSRQVPGRDRSEDCYRATEPGVEEFESWMRAMPNAAPVFREAMYGRIEFCRPENLPRLIRMARLEEAIADDLYQEAARRLRSYRKRREQERDFTREIREVLLYVDPKRWADRSEAYKEIAKRLEELHAEIKQLAPEALGG